MVFLRPNILPLVQSISIPQPFDFQPRLTKPNRGNSAKETSERVSADSNALVVGCLRGRGAFRRVLHIDFWKVLQERRKRQEATQYTLSLLEVSRHKAILVKLT
jgi:hypothetical protein